MGNYWRIFAEEVPAELGIILTDSQVDALTEALEGAHENYGMAHGYDCIPNPETTRANAAEKALKAERNKIQCKTCHGTGSLRSDGPSHYSISRCWKCHGEGRHNP